MKEQFIPYELALKLKELGFKEECLAKYLRYNPDDEIDLYPVTQNFFKGAFFNVCKNYECVECSAPLWQQAFGWFLKKYKLIGYISINNDTKFLPSIYKFEGEEIFLGEIVDCQTKAKTICLEKLVELCQ